MITLEAVTKVYTGQRSDVDALRGVTLSVQRGEFVAVVGASGSGKSTLLNIIGCLDRPTAGVYRFLGVDVGRLGDAELSRLRNHSIGFVFQAFNLVNELTVRENVEMPLVYDTRPHDRRTLALNALASVGLADLAEQPAAVLSGGEQQRAAIARALVNDPDVILADEPTGSIDEAGAAMVLDLLDTLHESERTILMVTHQPSVAARAQRAVRIVGGTVAPEASRRPGAAGRQR